MLRGLCDTLSTPTWALLPTPPAQRGRANGLRYFKTRAESRVGAAGPRNSSQLREDRAGPSSLGTGWTCTVFPRPPAGTAGRQARHRRNAEGVLQNQHRQAPPQGRAAVCAHRSFSLGSLPPTEIPSFYPCDYALSLSQRPSPAPLVQTLSGFCLNHESLFSCISDKHWSPLAPAFYFYIGSVPVFPGRRLESREARRVHPVPPLWKGPSRRETFRVSCYLCSALNTISMEFNDPRLLTV